MSFYQFMFILVTALLVIGFVLYKIALKLPKQ